MGATPYGSKMGRHPRHGEGPEEFMLIGYVSDEHYSALADVLLEFINEAGASWETRSRASGSVHLNLPPGDYRVVLQRPGFGAKFSHVTVPVSEPRQFRLLSDA